MTDNNNAVLSNSPKSSGEALNFIYNSGATPENETNFLEEATLISKSSFNSNQPRLF